MRSITWVFAMIAISLFTQPAVPQTGTVKGSINIQNMSGNNLGNFGCSNIRVGAQSLGQKRPWAWSVQSNSEGEIKTKRCDYTVEGVRANSTFTLSLIADFPNGCDLKTFKPSSSFPMKLSAGQVLRYDAIVYQITCTVVK